MNGFHKNKYSSSLSKKSHSNTLKFVSMNEEICLKHQDQRFENWSIFFADWKKALKNTYRKSTNMYDSINMELNSQIFGLPINMTQTHVPNIYFNIDELIKLTPHNLCTESLQKFTETTILGSDRNGNTMTNLSIPLITIDSFPSNEKKILIDGNHRYEQLRFQNTSLINFYHFTIEEVIQTNTLSFDYEKALLAYHADFGDFYLNRKTYNKQHSLVRYFI